MVLGLSVTPTTVGFVLVEGRGADGVTLDRDAFGVRAAGGVTAVTVSKHVAAAMLRTEAVAATAGHRLVSIGVTWSDEADWEGSVLLESLIESGFDNVVAVGLPEATEALARGIGRVVDFRKTAVCVVEPGAVMALEVDSGHGAIQTVVNDAVDSEAALVDWLTSVLNRADWQPDGLVVVGSGGDIDALTVRLRRELPVPVIAPAEAELAVARGAALAAAQDGEWAALDLRAAPVAVKRRRPMPVPYVGALTMLVAGVLTFVVSVSLAVGLKLTPNNAKPVDHRPVANTSDTPAMMRAVAPAVPPPIAEVPPPAAELPPITKVPPPAAEPPPEEAPVVDVPQAPPEQTQPDEQPPESVPPADVPAAVPPPPPVEPTTSPVPPAQTDQGTVADHSPLLTKILEHLPGLHKPPSEETPASTDQVAPPADAPPPPPPG